jgi:SH3-like domain-containing protein
VNVISRAVRGVNRGPVHRAAGVVAEIVECRDDWWRLDSDGFKGWLTRAEFWGVYPKDAVK